MYNDHQQFSLLGSFLILAVALSRGATGSVLDWEFIRLESVIC